MQTFEIHYDGVGKPNAGDLVIAFTSYRKREVVLFGDDVRASYPSVKMLGEKLDAESLVFVGSYDGVPVWTADGFSREAEAYTEPVTICGLRDCYPLVGDNKFWMAARASNLGYWRQRHSFCGVCGSEMQVSGNELSMKCPSCGEIYYPQIAPAIIVAITRGDEILMVQSKRWKAAQWGLVAGFVESGETLEEAVHREVSEETSLTISNVKYVKSQFWPFPNSLMIAFTADYAGGELNFQDEELRDARWYKPEDVPPSSSNLSVSRQMVEMFIEKQKNGA